MVSSVGRHALCLLLLARPDPSLDRVSSQCIHVRKRTRFEDANPQKLMQSEQADLANGRKHMQVAEIHAAHVRCHQQTTKHHHSSSCEPKDKPQRRSAKTLYRLQMTLSFIFRKLKQNRKGPEQQHLPHVRTHMKTFPARRGGKDRSKAGLMCTPLHPLPNIAINSRIPFTSSVAVRALLAKPHLRPRLNARKERKRVRTPHLSRR